MNTQSQSQEMALFHIQLNESLKQTCWIHKMYPNVPHKMWYIHVMEYYSAIKRNEAPTHATTRLYGNMLGARTQTKKGHILYDPIYRNV